eukprot:3829196-Pyramimonas_sp.AAC.1
MFLRAELVEAEGEHGALVHRLRGELPGPTASPPEALAGGKLCLEDLLDEQRFPAAFDLDVGGCFAVADADSLSSEEKEQLSSKVEQLKSGISDMARSPLAEAKSR